MNQELSSAHGLRCVLSGAEYNLLPNRVSQGADGVGRVRRSGVRMHAHAAEVAAKGKLQGGTGGGVEWSARRSQHFVNDGGNRRCRHGTHGRPLEQRRLSFATGVASRAAVRVPAAAALALQDAAHRGCGGFRFLDLKCRLPIHGEKLLAKGPAGIRGLMREGGFQLLSGPPIQPSLPGSAKGVQPMMPTCHSGTQ